MPIITEAQLRDHVRQPHVGMKLTLPMGTMFSPSAADFVKQWEIEVVFSDTSASPPSELPPQPSWDTPSTFPVKLSGELPRCVTCGTPLEHKPEHMTQLNAEVFAPKNTRRIILRGKLDSLQALCLLVGVQARAAGAGWLAGRLDSLAAYCRELMSAEYNERPVAPLLLDGLDESALRQVTHKPQENLGIPHLTPSLDDPPLLLWLNFLRCQVREAELVVLDALEIGPAGRDPLGLVQAMNRMSSAVYYLELLLVKGETTDGMADR